MLIHNLYNDLMLSIVYFLNDLFEQQLFRYWDFNYTYVGFQLSKKSSTNISGPIVTVRLQRTPQPLYTSPHYTHFIGNLLTQVPVLYNVTKNIELLVELHYFLVDIDLTFTYDNNIINVSDLEYTILSKYPPNTFFKYPQFTTYIELNPYLFEDDTELRIAQTTSEKGTPIIEKHYPTTTTSIPLLTRALQKVSNSTNDSNIVSNNYSSTDMINNVNITIPKPNVVGIFNKNDEFKNLYIRFNPITQKNEYCFSLSVEPLVKLNDITTDYSTKLRRTIQVRVPLTFYLQIPIKLFAEKVGIVDNLTIHLNEKYNPITLSRLSRSIFTTNTAESTKFTYILPPLDDIQTSVFQEYSTTDDGRKWYQLRVSIDYTFPEWDEEVKKDFSHIASTIIFQSTADIALHEHPQYQVLPIYDIDKIYLDQVQFEQNYTIFSFLIHESKLVEFQHSIVSPIMIFFTV